jgi:hypothetical protein
MSIVLEDDLRDRGSILRMADNPRSMLLSIARFLFGRRLSFATRIGLRGLYGLASRRFVLLLRLSPLRCFAIRDIQNTDVPRKFNSITLAYLIFENGWVSGAGERILLTFQRSGHGMGDKTGLTLARNLAVRDDCAPPSRKTHSRGC